MSGTRRNAALGWVVWKVGSRVAKKKVRDNRVKLGAAGALAAVVVGGAVAARANTSTT